MTLNKLRALNEATTRTGIIILLLALGWSPMKAQVSSISGIVNQYSKVTSLLISESGNPDSVIVSNPGIFEVDDIIMLYQPKGFSFSQADGRVTGFATNAGNYAYLIIDEIIGNTIVFNASTNFSPTAPGVESQLIKVPEYRDVTVDGLVTAPAWDAGTGIGGVVALYVRGKITLNSDIDVTGKGFAGADPSADTYGHSNCYTDVGVDFKERYYTLAAEDSAGLKGESAIRSNFVKLRGFGRLANGGGGGNGRYSGGGGGSNRTSGGAGGGQSNVCGDLETETAGEGGDGFGTTYYNNGGLYPNRIFFGGGGGTGTQDSPNFDASAGGDGGGIVVIIADTIVSSGGSIIANGESALSPTDGAGGGGGGGGAIILDANGFLGNIPLVAVGGDGGSTNNSSFYTGPGGGGGGGIYWVSKNESLDPDLTGIGLGGLDSPLGGNPGTNGAAAILYTGLQAPLNGFLFNTLPLDKTVCSDVIPSPIDASKPKGGLGPGSYTYLWESNTGDPGVPGDWGPADGTNTQEDYNFPSPLTVTTHFRRIVTSGTISDGEDLWVTYTVLPAITGNVIAAPDTVCQFLAPNEIRGAAVLGGANVGTDETYSWEEKSPGGGDWVAVGAFDSIFSPPGLAEVGIYQFRRVVTSDVCVSESNAIDIEVLEPISNNIVTSRDTICNGQVPDLLDGGGLVGGDAANTWWKWEVSPNGVSGFNTIGGEEGEDYAPSAGLVADRFYRRTVFSGIDSACVDVSDVFKIEVLDDITNNVIVETQDTVCLGSELPGNGFESSSGKPIGGDSDYTYLWQVNPDAAGWSTIDTDQVINGGPDGVFNNSFSAVSSDVRRVVLSGKDDVCKDTSDFITIKTVPVITNNTRISDDTAACEAVAINPILFNNPGGGNLGYEDTYAYQWQQRTSGEFVDIAGATALNYTPDPLSDTTEFRRIVFSAPSGFCSDTSTQTVTVTITPIIETNTINPANIDYICFDETLLLEGSASSGGDGTYFLQWQEKIGVGSFTDIGGETAENYIESNYSQSKEFRRIVVSDVCADTSNIATIAVRQLPEALLELNNEADSVICEKEVLFKVTITTPEAFDWHRVRLDFSPYGEGDTVSSGENPDNPMLIPHSPQTDDSITYIYNLGRVVDNKGCVGTILNGIPSVKVYQKPEPQLEFADTEVCGELINIEGSELIGADYAEWLEIGTDLLNFGDVSSASTSMELDTIRAGYRYNIQQVEFGWRMVTPRCDSTASRIFTFYQEPSPTDTLLTDTSEFYVEETHDLAQWAPEPFAGTGAWSVDNSGAVIEGTAIAAGFTYETPHTYTWTITNGVCPPQIDELVVIQHDLRQYNAFSPDNDGFNQEFVIPGLIHSDEFTFTLYNNWGTQVAQVAKDTTGLEPPKKLFEIDGEMEEEYLIWDGTLGTSGQAAPPGTYYYSLSYKIGGREFEPKKGYILLRR